MTKQRLHHFDVIKGIAILLVVMGHVMILGIHDIDKAFIFKLLDKIHMPLFFFISGYFSYKFVEGKMVGPNIFARFKQLIIPFFCVSTLWMYYFPHSGIESPFNATWIGLYTDPYKLGYWFTLCLFEILLIYSVVTFINNLIRSTWVQIFILISIYILFATMSIYGNYYFVNIFGIEFIREFLPIFFIGVFASKYKGKFNTITQNQYAITASIIMGSLLIYFNCYFWEFNLEPRLEWLSLVVSKIFLHLSIVIGSLLIYFNCYFWEFNLEPRLELISRMISEIFLHISVVIILFTIIKPWSESEFAKESPSKIIKILQFFGKESLSIYLLHYFFIFPISSLRQPMIDMGLGFIPLMTVSLTISLVIIGVALGVSSIISKSKLLSILLLGKN